MKLKPLGSNLIIESAPEETKTASGILLPDTASKEQQDRGTVIAIGPGKVLENGSRQTIDVQIGNVVIFKKWGKEEIELEDGGGKKKFLIVSADEVMAIIE
ncbi:MAG: co-chaperone GroES [Patescibacteria group bacterium]|jgi:chaperonin GroES